MTQRIAGNGKKSQNDRLFAPRPVIIMRIPWICGTAQSGGASVAGMWHIPVTQANRQIPDNLLASMDKSAQMCYAEYADTEAHIAVFVSIFI